MKLLFFVVAIIATVSSEELTGLEEFTNGNIKFSADVYKELLKKEKGNFVFSPFSAEVVLALTQAGAKGETAEEFVSSVSLPTSQEKTQQALKSIFPNLKKSDENLALSSANKMYLAENFTVQDAYKNLATNLYEAGVENVDFEKGEAAAEKINSWVEDKTNKRIKNLIDPKSLDGTTRLVLVNALYFKGRWASEFEKYATRKDKFYRTATESADVDFMNNEDDFRYFECNKTNAKFLELPYIGGDVSMTIILPNEKEGLRALEESSLEGLLKPHPLEFKRVAVKLPKWKVDTSIDFKPILQNLGLKKVFNAQEADLSGITGRKDLYVDEVKQKAFIEVNEAGTEAAAATYGKVSLLSAPVVLASPIPFVADHPFLYVIKYKEIVLFAGKVTE